ncbi:MAG: hypothetical protein IPF53_17950 [Blastocatellia bacterium]|nr:hypothetical protein [Blastocatellia bacterium]MBK6426783.1 hypothetical protein [Blastocatellia bacterium]
MSRNNDSIERDGPDHPEPDAPSDPIPVPEGDPVPVPIEEPADEERAPIDEQPDRPVLIVSAQELA